MITTNVTSCTILIRWNLSEIFKKGWFRFCHGYNENHRIKPHLFLRNLCRRYKINCDGIIDEYDVDVLFFLFNNWCQMILLIRLKVRLQGSCVLLQCDTSKANLLSCFTQSWLHELYNVEWEWGKKNLQKRSMRWFCDSITQIQTLEGFEKCNR